MKATAAAVGSVLLARFPFTRRRKPAIRVLAHQGVTSDKKDNS